MDTRSIASAAPHQGEAARRKLTTEQRNLQKSLLALYTQLSRLLLMLQAALSSIFLALGLLLLTLLLLGSRVWA